ncbi:MAG: methylamine dehydrogenase accessory protein MauD [Myxococcota bacterium]
MIEALVTSQLLLWVALLALGALVLALLRQVGQLHERIAPVGALVGAELPAVGDHAPVFELRDWSGRVRKLGGIHPEARRTLLFFVSPTCPVCKELLPTLRSLCAAEGLDRVVASDGPREEHAAFVARHGLAEEPYVLSGELGRAYQVGRLPHAVLLDGEGVVRGRGLVNSREHLESLLEADRRGVASVQDYLGRRSGSDGSRRAASG